MLGYFEIYVFSILQKFIAVLVLLGLKHELIANLLFLFEKYVSPLFYNLS